MTGSKLKFSTDSVLLAISTSHGIAIVDVMTGEMVASCKSKSGSIRWSADSDTITIVTPVAGSDQGGRFDIYPAVYEHDWRSDRLIRSLNAQ